LGHVYSVCFIASVRGDFAHIRGHVRHDVLPHVNTAALREPNWPTRASQFAYSFSNQFELPILFYVLTILEIITRHADLLFVVLAWIFVVMRWMQALVHVTNNNVRTRGAFYGIGAIILVIMWVIYIVRILLALP
jgi:hypothetical protein